MNYEGKELTQLQSEFLTRLTHDMKTPLTAIIGLTELGMHGNQNARDMVYFGKIRDSADYMLKLLNNILEFQSLSAGNAVLEPSPCLLSDLIDRVETMVRPSADLKQQHFSVFRDQDADRLFVMQDVHRVEQILLNVLNNAVKYTALGGNVSWRSSISTEGDRIWVTNVIEDNGPGIRPEFLPRLYEAFSQNEHRLSRYESGAGLGLAIVKQSLDLMGGTIECDSEMGRGTTFSIRIPGNRCTPEEEDAYRRRRRDLFPEADDPVFAGLRILVAQSTRLDSEILMQFLNQRGAETEYAPDGAVALQKARTARYDAILMDIRMPVMNGLESAQRIRQFDKATPIIGLTERALPSNTRRALEAGMNSCIRKPAEAAELIAVLEEELSGREKSDAI